MANKYATTIWIAASVAALGAGYAASSRADTVVIDDQLAVRKSDMARPARGATMTAVAAKFGAPTAKHDAVGTPPITRWDYPQFAVFFEKDRVIDAVIPPSADEPTTSSASNGSAEPHVPAAAAPQTTTAPSSAPSASSAPVEPIPASVPEHPAAQQPTPSEDPVGVVPVSISPASHDASTAASSTAASPAAAKPPAATIPPHP